MTAFLLSLWLATVAAALCFRLIERRARKALNARAESAEANEAYWKVLSDDYLTSELEVQEEVSRLTADLALAYTTRDEAFVKIGEQERTILESQRVNRTLSEEIATLQGQVSDRDEKIAELEAKLAALNPPRKRYNKKQETPAPVAESEAAHG